MGNEKNSVTIGVAVDEQILEEWEKEVEAEDWSSRSEYIRSNVQAGRKQLAQLHPAESSGSDTIRQQILNQIPDKEDAITKEDTKPPDTEDIIKGIVSPMEAEIEETVDEMIEGDQITYSAKAGGFVK